MTTNNNKPANDEDRQRFIQRTLKQNQKKTVTVKEYCQFSTTVLQLKNIQDLLYTSYQELLASTKKNQLGNSRILAGFLCFPNVNFNQIKVIKDKKNVDLLMDAGKKIIGTISYAWDYYIRLIKKKRENRSTNEIQANTLISAKTRLTELLLEMKQNKYHWENYTKQNLTNKHYQEKEIKEEQIQIDLLKKLLKTQIYKMEKKYRQIPDNLDQNIKQGQKQNEEQIDFGYLQSQENKKKIHQLIDIGEYFKYKKNSRNTKKSATDTITKIQEQRQSTTSVLRFFSTYKK